MEKAGFTAGIAVERGLFHDIGVNSEVLTIYGGPPLAAIDRDLSADDVLELRFLHTA